MSTYTIVFRRSPAAEWLALDPVLRNGEIARDSDTGLFKIGDGTSKWSELDYSATLPERLVIGRWFP